MTRLPPTGWRPQRGQWKRIRCPICGAQVVVTPNGHVRAHQVPFGVDVPTQVYGDVAYCMGSWGTPTEIVLAPRP